MKPSKNDLMVADRLEQYADKLAESDDIASGRMTPAEYINIMSALRYGTATLRETKKARGLYAEPENEDDTYGKELLEGETIYLLGVEGKVVMECGAWGWGSHEYVPWEELEKRIPHNNQPRFCYCDNFISFWELKWNFDNGNDWDGVPFIKHSKEKQELKNESK